MPRPQFSIRTLLWLTLVVAAFLGGYALAERRWINERSSLQESLHRAKLEQARSYEQTSLRDLRIADLESGVLQQERRGIAEVP